MRANRTTLLLSVLLAVCACARSVTAAPPALSIQEVFPELNGQPTVSAFHIEYLDSPGGTMQVAGLGVRLSNIESMNALLIGSAEGYRITFSVQPRDAYLVLRIKEIVEPVPGTLMKLRFRTPDGSPFVLTRLDYMSVPTDGDRGMSWPWIWAGTGVRCQVSGVRSQGAGVGGDDAGESGKPLGAFAIQRRGTDAEFDENLLKMWVHDGLPHPKTEGEWTLEKARSWLTEWQERFSDQSCLVIGAKDRNELDTMTAWTEKLGMKRIYLHTDTWRGEYWPVNNSYLHVNTNVFPRGEKDLNAYTAALREKGMSFAVHSTVISIGRHDPDYVRNGVHPGLARWVRGTLEKDAAAKEGTLHFRPAPGSKYPRTVQWGWSGPNTVRHFMNLALFLVGDELVSAGAVTNTDPPSREATARHSGDVWVLKHCRRGEWGTQAAAHPAGTVTEGMLRGYGQAFVPDSDSALFEETIRRWADFCTRNNVDHLECDALEIHQDRPWGPAKFSWLLSSNLRLPSTSNTSSGRPLPFQIEYWFRSSQRVASGNARAGVAGGASLPLYLHSDIRQATGPYEILFKPAQMVGGGGRSFNISYPWPMFGVTPEILANHGMVPEVEKLIADWREVLSNITPGQREAMACAFSHYRGAAGRGNQAATDVLFRPEVVDGENRIVPLRLVGRAGGELNWGFGQEFGPIVPRQYMQVGDSMELANAYHAQEPEFVIRVMGMLVEVGGDEHRTPNIEHRTSNEDKSNAQGTIEESYAAGTTTDFSVHPLHSARHIWPASEMHNGEAKPGKVDVRCGFRVPDPGALKRARLYLQVDDEATAYVNGKKVFAGGRYDQALFVDLTDLRQGKNVLIIKATNFGAPGCVTAALHLETADGTRVLGSDTSWTGRLDGGVWGKVADLGAYGGNVWPKAKPQLAVLRSDLMPNGSTIEPAVGHDVTMDGDALQIACRNDSDAVVAHIDDRPAWATLLDMGDTRGVGCTVTGDGSGALLVITIGEHSQRDYVVPIDFTGTREIEIPSGEVAWGHSKWGWRRGTAKFDYARIRKVRVGLGTVPPKTHAKVTVSNIRPLREEARALSNLGIGLGDGRYLVVEGPVPSGHYLWYRGGDSVGLYDLRWNKVRDLAVRQRNFVFPAGNMELSIESQNSNQRPWLEMQFFTKGSPLL